MKPTSFVLNATTSAIGASFDLPEAFGVDDATEGRPVEHLGDLALAFRDEFRLDGVIAETAILSSLKDVADHAGAPERWLALFNSPLGAALRSRGRDLNTAMGFVLTQLPRKAT